MAEVEAREPDEITEAMADTAEEKAGRGTGAAIVLGLLAGAYIALGGLFAVVAGAGADGMMPHGAVQVLAGAVFSVGLILVLLAGGELFTGNTLMVVGAAKDRFPLGDLFGSWVLVWVANLVGSLLVVALALAAGFHEGGDGAVGARAAEVAANKAGKAPLAIVASGVLANVLVVLAVWMAAGGRSAADKVLVIVLPIAGFVAMDLEHSVANMSLLPLGLGAAALMGPEAGAVPGWGPVAANIALSTLGNALGGAAIGLAYWVATRRG